MLNMQKIKRVFFLLSTIIFIILIIFSEIRVNNDIKASKGVLNLNHWDFTENGDVKLKGNWDLYYNELLMPEDLKTLNTNSYYNIPGRLSEQVAGKKHGYMTLHLKIYVPKDEIYGIYFNSLFTASDIWVNDVHLDGNGKIGTSISNEKPIYRPIYIFFPSVNNVVDIIIHTSTYIDLEPTLKAATFGTKKQIMNLNYKNTSIDGFIIGIMFIMGILSLGFYFTKPRQKRNFYFSCICLVMILRCLIFNSRLLVEFYPNMPYEVLSKLAAITFYIFVTLYILFLDDMFQNRLIIRKMSVVYGAGFTLLCIFTNNTIYDRAAIYAQVIVSFFVVYLAIIFIKEIHNKNVNAEKNFFPFIIICLTGLNDILVNNSVLYNPYFVLYGIIVFIIAQSIFIVNDYLEKHRKLDYINRDGLTSLYNNKFIKEILSNQFEQNKVKREKFSLIMIDIDDFKGINDNFGHMFGDKILVDVASILCKLTEEKGYAARFGGDEFIVILPETIEKEALIMAEEIRRKIVIINEKYEINKNISVSIGVYENDTDDLFQCINNVDSAMYKAKTLGKNCICSFVLKR